MSLEYRREDFINNNLSLCESDCEYLGYEKEAKKAKCECTMKNQINLDNNPIDIKKIYQKFLEYSFINIDIIKCYYLLFNKENIISNIGNYVLLFIIFTSIIELLIFCLKGKQLLYQIIISITKNIKNKI